MALNYVQFQATKKMFKEYAFSGASFPMAYTDWSALDDDLKGAALYINFYSQIILAWPKAISICKLDSPTCDTETVVSDFLMTLTKNVAIIKANPKRYTPGYIYTLAKRSFICMLRQPKYTRVYDAEMSNEISTAEDEILDLFDLVPFEDDPIEVVQAREAIWAIIEGMGPKALKVANHLITDDPLSRSKNKVNDRLADVSVSSKEYPIIVAQIREKIAPYAYVFNF